jgi:hypothetical protein
LPANQKVSVAWQIVFTFISILNLWAFYRIRKLGKYVLYVIVPEIILTVFYGVYYYTNVFSRFEPNTLNYGSPYFGNGGLAVWLVTTAISLALQALSIYLVIIWSRQHNTQFDQRTSA